MEDTVPGPQGIVWGRYCGMENRRGEIASPVIVTINKE